MSKNILGYDVLSGTMSNKIMGPDIHEKELTEEQVNEIITTLDNFDIPDPRTLPFDNNLTHDDFSVDKLQDENIEYHFETIAKKYSGWIKKALLKFAKVTLPEKPKHVKGIATEGWYLYDNESDKWFKSPEGILEEVAIFDTETFVKSELGNWAILATAVTDSSYYVYAHESFLNPHIPFTKKLVEVGQLVKILIGHNVCFDYARISDAYTLAPSNYIFIDTRSLFNVTHGLTSDLMKSFEIYKFDNPKFPYADFGAKADLVSAYNFYWRHDEPMEQADKEIRRVFVDSKTIFEMHDIGGKEDLMLYAIDDAYYTFKLFSKVIVDYFVHCPMYTAFYAMIILGTPRMPLDNNFWEWYSKCEEKFEETQEYMASTLQTLADELYEAFKSGKFNPDDDPWFGQLDWSCNTMMSKRVTKRYFVYRTDKSQSEVVEVEHGDSVKASIEAHVLKTKGSYELTNSGAIRSKKIGEDIEMVKRYPHLYGIPAWYVQACKSPITTKSQLSHYLLGLSWLNEPIIKTKDKGWCIYKDGVLEKVPHKKGKEENVGNMLTRDFISYYEKGLMQARSDKAKKLMEGAVACSYWLSVRSRVGDVLTTLSRNPYGPDALMCGSEISPHNTISGRGGQRLWYTVPGTEGNEHKIGSEIKTRVCAPEGWSIVGGDIDSEEAAIFAMYADCKYGVSGSSPIGNILITGSKENKDDVHYRLAAVADIPRKPAKTINYGVAYGAGFPTIDKALAKENPTMPERQRHSLVERILMIKKGNKCGGRYVGGMDSEGFNYMLDLLEDDTDPRTPFLETLMSEAILPCNDIAKRNFTSVQNWTIQRSGSDFLACMLVACNYLNDKYNLGALFCISMHDEIFYLVPKHNEMKFAACFLMAHIWTWALFHYRLKLYDVPLRRLFISGVYVGNRWSKDLSSTKTITNPINDQDGREIGHKELIPIMKELFSADSTRKTINK